MVTNIVHMENSSDTSTTVLNSENVGNSAWLQPQDASGQSIWIPWHWERPLVVHTKKGVCRIVDENWKLKGRWENDGGGDTVFLHGGGDGVGGDVKLTIRDDGNISRSAGLLWVGLGDT
jgi:hypothetical protein